MEEKEEKRFIELNEEERKQVYKSGWKKAKPIVMKILITILILIICFLMVITLIPKQ